MTTKVDNYELEPCPFCGGEKLGFDAWGKNQFVYCIDGCGCTGPVDLGKSGAAEKWNERHDNRGEMTIHKFGAYKKVRLRKPTTCCGCGYLMPYRTQAMRCGIPAFCLKCWKVITRGVSE